jgi:hypothetical protein
MGCLSFSWKQKRFQNQKNAAQEGTLKLHDSPLSGGKVMMDMKSTRRL